MKFRYFLTSILACLALAIGCTQEELPGLSEIKVTPSYITLPMEGGDYEVTVNAKTTWAVKDAPEWLTITPSSGNGDFENGEVVKISVEPSTSEKARAAYLNFECAGESQLVTVNQEAFVPDFPEFKEGDYWIAFGDGVATPVNSAYGYLYTAKATVSEDGKISSTADNIFTFKAVDGGFTIQDPAGKYYYMQGTYTSFNLAADLPATGGVWTVKQTGEKDFLITNTSNGKFMQYDPSYSSAGAYDSPKDGGIWPNLVNTADAEVAEVMFAVEPTELSLKKEAGEFEINMTCKNEDFEIVPSADWIVLKSMTSKEGEYVVTFSYSENTLGARTATIDFISNGETITVEVEQEGSIVELSVADFLAKDKGAALYKLTGKVANLKTGNYGNFDLVDGSGSVYVYGLTATPVEKNDQSFPTLGIKEGDVVTLIGTRDEYKGTAQVGGPAYYVSHIGHTETTVADFLAKEKGDARYKLTGKIANLKTGDYGNFDLVDETGSVYVYGLTVAPVAKNDKSFPTLGLKEGDIVTLIGTRDEYKGTPQVGGPAYYISHTEGTVEPSGATVEGKQWVTELMGFQVLIDLGVTEEGVMAIAIGEDASSYVLAFAGSYVVNATDATSGTVVGSLLDFEANEEFTQSFPYTDLTESSVTINAEDFFDVSDLEFTKATEYVEFTVPGDEGDGDVTENSIENGVYWIVNAELQKLMTPLAEDKSYGYPSSEDMIDGASYAKNAFKFTYNADESRYTIQDSFGRYLYMSGDYNSFSVSSELPAEGAYWSVEGRSDGTYDIYNGENGKSISYSPSYGSWEAKLPSDPSFSGIYPTLVKADNPVAEPEPPTEEADEVIKMSDVIAAMGLTETTNLPEGTPLTIGGLTVTYTHKNSSSVSNLHVGDGGLRWYQDDILNIVASKPLAKIEFVSYGGKNGPVAADNGTMDEAGLVWTGDASEINFTATKQIRVSEIKLTYKK